jgi:hypothetical protein
MFQPWVKTWSKVAFYASPFVLAGVGLKEEGRGMLVLVGVVVIWKLWKNLVMRPGHWLVGDSFRDEELARRINKGKRD